VLPWLWQQVLDCLGNNWSSLGELEAIIRQDHSLSSRLLGAANSTYYAGGRQITTVARASAVLGLEEVRRLCLAAGLSQLLDGGGDQRREMSEQLWRHCLEVGEVAALLARGRQGLNLETAFTAGLLHDLGKVLLLARFPRAYRVVRQLQERAGLSWQQAEEPLGLDHQELGLYLAEHWNLPPLLTEVIGCHHQPHAGLANWPMVATVYLADWLVRQEEDLQAGRPQAQPPEETWLACLGALRLDPPGLESCRRRYRAGQRARRLAF
jgi:putative nucleotidyltransferase with HDIG domain